MLIVIWGEPLGSGVPADGGTGIGAVVVVGAVVVAAGAAGHKENPGRIVRRLRAIQGQVSATWHNCDCWNEQAPGALPTSSARFGSRSTERGRMDRVEETCEGALGRQRWLLRSPEVLMVNSPIH